MGNTSTTLSEHGINTINNALSTYIEGNTDKHLSALIECIKCVAKEESILFDMLRLCPYCANDELCQNIYGKQDKSVSHMNITRYVMRYLAKVQSLYDRIGKIEQEISDNPHGLTANIEKLNSLHTELATLITEEIITHETDKYKNGEKRKHKVYAMVLNRI